MFTTWLIINCRGISEPVRKTIIDTAIISHNPHYYEHTPWLELANNSEAPIPTIQIFCESQKDAIRLRKKLREACAPYGERFPHSRDPSKERILNPLDGQVLFHYTDEDGNDLDPSELPARTAG